MGAVEILIIWENFEHQRVTVKHPQTGEESVHILDKVQEADHNSYMRGEDGVELELVDKVVLIEWFAENYKKYGCELEFITGK